MKDMICIVCPVGCHLFVDHENHITGNLCSRGEKYGLTELLNPTRTLTSTVRTTSKDLPRLSVKTKSPIPKSYIFDALSFMDSVIVDKNVKIGDIVVKNLLNTGVDLVATKNIEIDSHHEER